MRIQDETPEEVVETPEETPEAEVEKEAASNE